MVTFDDRWNTAGFFFLFCGIKGTAKFSKELLLERLMIRSVHDINVKFPAIETQSFRQLDPLPALGRFVPVPLIMPPDRKLSRFPVYLTVMTTLGTNRFPKLLPERLGISRAFSFTPKLKFARRLRLSPAAAGG
jgi:hypothetical protein